MTSNEAEIDWSAYHERSKQKRAQNRADSAKLLTEAGLSFYTNNQGAHLIVSHNGKTVDFWPGTGLWNNRKGKQQRGVNSLIKYLMKEENASPS